FSSFREGASMQLVIRLGLAAVLAAALAQVSGIPSGSLLATTALAQEVRQIKLTEKQVQGFIAAQKDLAPIMEKIQGATTDQVDPKVQAQLEAAVKKSGFKDMAEYDEVAANISMVMAGIDPQTKTFTDPQAAIKKEIADVTADKTMSADDKKQV